MTLGPLMIDIAGTELAAEDCELLRHPLVGGVILFSRNFRDVEQLRELTRSIRAVRSPAVLIAVDQEGGRVQRFRDGFTALPPLRWLGREYDADPARARQLAMLHARVMASELLDAGVDFSFAPVVDIDYGLCEVIGDRSPHRDPEAVAAIALAYLQGLRQAGMAAVAKHFPGHGAVVGDSHLMLPEDRREYAALLDDMRPYGSLISNGLKGVMMAHIRYSGVCPEVASLSEYWIQRVLRSELGFRGAVFSDDLSMAGARETGTAEGCSLAALRAGADMILICNDRPAVETVVAALDANVGGIASRARLAAMRPQAHPEFSAAVGSPAWQRQRDELLAAAETPPLKLDGTP